MKFLSFNKTKILLFRIVTENPSGDVDYFITSELNAENLKSYSSQAICVRPDWLWDCHNNKALVSTDGYIL